MGKLSATAVKAATRPGRLGDGDGLFLVIQPGCGKSWMCRAQNIKDACRMTGIWRSKLYLLIADGAIEAIKVGSMTLIPIASLEAFLRSQKDSR